MFNLHFSIFNSKHTPSFAYFLLLSLKHQHLPWRPVYTWLSKTFSVRVEITGHGDGHDGYSQTTKKGILSAVQTLDTCWTRVSKENLFPIILPPSKQCVWVAGIWWSRWSLLPQMHSLRSTSNTLFLLPWNIFSPPSILAPIHIHPQRLFLSGTLQGKIMRRKKELEFM